MWGGAGGDPARSDKSSEAQEYIDTNHDSVKGCEMRPEEDRGGQQARKEADEGQQQDSAE